MMHIALQGQHQLKISFSFSNEMNFFRHGDNGNYLYFSTTALKLSNSDSNIDAENLGNSTLVAYLVISLVLIIGYIVDGREFIQESILEVSF